MAYTKPTVTDFKAYFLRDFPYQPSGTADLKYVQDADIQKAMDQASFNFSDRFYDSQTNFNIGFFYLTAHYLVVDLRASSQGIAGSYNWLTASKGAGSVNESFSIPQRILDNPELAMYSKTPYGAKYLSLILPQLIGQIFVVCGRTTP